ncbi:MAG: 16S rRNA (uracil(1498)-N(3))-methyltransferase [Thermodesulfovibrionales bacterium]|nr:16S rRNA (uracil(1498)-N(3))-methyltransferase [Thermodesulfovibrionales bacterium]
MTVYVPPSEIQDKKEVTLDNNKSHYLINVMRCNPGSLVSIIDGRGRAFKGKIKSIRNGIVEVSILEEIFLDTELPFDLILVQSLIKGHKMDLVIQKATELGVKEIIPVVTERVIVRETRKLGRWQKIAEEATEQCNRAVIPNVRQPVTLQNFCNQLSSEFPNLSKGLIFWEEGGKRVKDAFKEVIESRKKRDSNWLKVPFFLVIGPEGGLTYREVTLAEESGFVRTSLGKRLLKSETASIISIALMQFLLEEFVKY